MELVAADGAEVLALRQLVAAVGARYKRLLWGWRWRRLLRGLGGHLVRRCLHSLTWVLTGGLSEWGCLLFAVEPNLRSEPADEAYDEGYENHVLQQHEHHSVLACLQVRDNYSVEEGEEDKTDD